MDINGTREEFENLWYFNPTSDFNGIVIIPTNEAHESGYMCMKFALLKGGEVVGCIGGGSDVIHLDGIGGYGNYDQDYETRLKTRMSKITDWSIDCLPNGLLRLFCSHNLETDNIVTSDFNLYVRHTY